MRKPLAEKRGFSVRKTDRGVAVRKSASPFSRVLFVSPFIAAAFVLAVVATLVSGYLPFVTIRERNGCDMGLWTAIGLGAMFLTGAGVAWWFLVHLVLRILPVEKRIDRAQGSVICRAFIWRLVYLRRALKLPLNVVVQVYDSHGDPCFRVFLRDAKGRHFLLTIPTVVGSRSGAKEEALALGVPIARRLKADIVVETRTRAGWCPPEKLDSRDWCAHRDPTREAQTSSSRVL